jgi:ADP-ribose pyrophosphatase YjhB (NUDIX family)
MKFCSQCGAPVSRKIPPEDDRERHVCDACGTIHYINPKVVVGCLPLHGDQVLLCKRAIHPRKGYWTLPAGFLENGETSLQGALRETWEEARAQVSEAVLYTVFDLPHISQIYMFYRAQLQAPEFAAGQESLDVALFHEHQIPWDQLAFPVITDTLRYFFLDRVAAEFPVRSEVIDLSELIRKHKQSRQS